MTQTARSYYQRFCYLSQTTERQLPHCCQASFQLLYDCVSGRTSVSLVDPSDSASFSSHYLRFRPFKLPKHDAGQPSCYMRVNLNAHASHFQDLFNDWRSQTVPWPVTWLLKKSAGRRKDFTRRYLPQCDQMVFLNDFGLKLCSCSSIYFVVIIK